MRLSLPQLELLVGVDSRGSVSGAARAMGVTQPYASRMLKLLEQQLGFPVFERDSNGARPTARGAEVVARARAALAEMRSLEQITETPESRAARLVFFALNAAEIVVQLGAQLPELVVTFEHVEPEAAFAQLRSGTADAFVGLRIPHATWPEQRGVTMQEIALDPTVVFLPEGHPLAGAGELDLAQLADADWITGEDPDSRRMLLAECRAAGFEPRMRYFSVEGNLVRSLLASGRAVTLGSSVAPRGPGFVAVPYRRATAAAWMLVQRVDRERDDFVRALPEATRAVFDEMRRKAEAFDAAGAG